MEFGINFVDDEKLLPVGCTAVVRDVLQRYEDGRMDIVVEGRRRYHVRQVFEGRAPYTVGSVVFIEDSPGSVDEDLALETVSLYDKLVEVVYGDRVRGLRGRRIRDVSFVIAQKAGMEARDRQRLLEMRSENQRLRALRDHLSGTIPKLQRAQEIQRIARCDGYIVNQEGKENA
jgi:ATP-dependent Lon protease